MDNEKKKTGYFFRESSGWVSIKISQVINSAIIAEAVQYSSCISISLNVLRSCSGVPAKVLQGTQSCRCVYLIRRVQTQRQDFRRILALGLLYCNGEKLARKNSYDGKWGIYDRNGKTGIFAL